MHNMKYHYSLGKLNVFCYAEYFLYTTLLPNFYPVNMQHSSCMHVLSVRVENGVDPDPMASLEAS